MPETDERVEAGWSRLAFNEWLLGGVVALMLAGAALSVALYSLPVPHLQLAELQPSIRVARVGDFPTGGSRIANWGDDVILVIRTGEATYTAIEGVSPLDGCILEWDNAAMLVRSPCADVAYDLHGNVVRGLTRIPLKRFTVFVRQDAVHVTAI